MGCSPEEMTFCGSRHTVCVTWFRRMLFLRIRIVSHVTPRRRMRMRSGGATRRSGPPPRTKSSEREMHWAHGAQGLRARTTVSSLADPLALQPMGPTLTAAPCCSLLLTVYSPGTWMPVPCVPQVYLLIAAIVLVGATLLIPAVCGASGAAFFLDHAATLLLTFSVVFNFTAGGSS